MEQKACNKCKVVLPLTSEYFRKNSSNKTTGFRGTCKQCDWRGPRPGRYEYQISWTRKQNLRKTDPDLYYSLLEENRQKRLKSDEQKRQTKRDYVEANREKYREHSRNRVHLKRSTCGGEYILRDVVFERDGGVCHICNEPVDPGDWHLDHVIPLSKGGPHSYENVAVSHPRCNLSKSDKILFDNL